MCSVVVVVAPRDTLYEYEVYDVTMIEAITLETSVISVLIYILETRESQGRLSST